MRHLMALIVALILSSCTAVSAGTPTAPVQETDEAWSRSATQAALAERSTSVAGTQAAADSARETQVARTQQAEQRLSTRRAATEEAIQMATQAAAPMAEIVDGLRAEGLLASSEGSYTQLEPFDESWAQLNWYQYYYLDLSPTDFVLRADATWDSASDRADWWNSGCGIVFRETNVDNHYLAYLGLDGYAYLTRFRKGVWAQLGRSYYGRVDIPSGSASFMLVVEGNQFTFYVNETRVLQRQDSAHPEGSLAYTLVSGTNKGFGTRCQLNDVQLWTLK